MKLDIDKATEHLDEALDHLLALRQALGIDDVPIPAEGLDGALGADDEVKKARRQVRRLLDHLLSVGTEDQRAAVLRLEERYNLVVSLAAEVGWRSGWMAARGGR